MIKLCFSTILAGLLFLSLGSCQKESQDIPANLQNPALTGKWYLKAITEQTSVDTSLNVKQDPLLLTVTADDYFEFKAQNAATYSSTIIGKRYDGYYSVNPSVTPELLNFKSGIFTEAFNISKVSKDSLVIYKTASTKNNTVITTVTDYYTYKH